jgi:putative ABC transport system permease protein
MAAAWIWWWAASISRPSRINPSPRRWWSGCAPPRWDDRSLSTSASAPAAPRWWAPLWRTSPSAELSFAQGNAFAFLGDAVLGANAARRLRLKLGDTLVSQPSERFDLAASTQTRLKVVGILRPSGTADDDVIFTDLKTTWVMAGIGHGHQALDAGAAADLILERSGQQVTANARLPLVADVSADSLGQFHFHGDPNTFPVSAILVDPNDRKSADLLLGRYTADRDAELVALAPIQAVERLLLTTFRLRRLFNAVSVVVGIAALLLMILLFSLSLRMRREEFRTCQRIGARRSVLIAMVLAEVGLLLGVAAVATAGLVQRGGRKLRDQPRS